MICPFLDCNEFCPFQRCIQFSMRTSPNPLSVTSQDISMKNDKIHEALQIPILHGQINPQILNNINKNINNDILEFKSEMETAADENAKEAEMHGRPITHYEISNTYLITYNKNNILSISIIYQQYINGRSSYIRTTYNYDLSSGESMSIGSLFKPNTDYIGTLNKLITSKIHGNTNQFKGIAKDQPYYLDNDNLVIFFRFNEIAPVGSEIPVIKIPFSELSSILKPQLLRS
ncbi:PdaC/SigV domain-containing protein [Clostridium thailandense]|uniref:PdaC/SigV domain-containing protein n=1 Tax=Clostridium thailandense TaxID=2794346 RepID=UPI0039896E13